MFSPALRDRIEERFGKFAGAILFGSVAKGTADQDSDCDILILTGMANSEVGSYILWHENARIHLSLENLGSWQMRIPPKWWEPVANGILLEHGSQQEALAQIKARAERLWSDSTARRKAAALSLSVLVSRQATFEALDPSLDRDVQLREWLDGIASVSAFVSGVAEPSKHARLSGLAERVWPLMPRLGTMHHHLLRPGTCNAEQCESVLVHWGCYVSWLRCHSNMLLHRSFDGQQNHWRFDMRRARAESRWPDIWWYMCFVLDRLHAYCLEKSMVDLLCSQGFYMDLRAVLHPDGASLAVQGSRHVLKELHEFVHG